MTRAIKEVADQAGRNKIVLAVVAAVAAIFLVILAIIFISPLVFGRLYFIIYLANGQIYAGKASCPRSKKVINRVL